MKFVISIQKIKPVTVITLAISFLVFPWSPAAGQEPSVSGTSETYPPELRQLHQNVLKETLEEPMNMDEVVRLAEKLTSGGSWDDIDYTSKERGGWKPADHLSRILSMVVAFQKINSPVYHQKELSGRIHLALKYWFDNDFQCPNWWYPEIGVPKILNPLMLLMEGELSPWEKEKGITILDRSKIGMTGQNKVWQSGNVLLKSLLLRDTVTIRKAAESIKSELVIGLKEGVQPDWSFHQHGPQLQFGNYGMAYADDMIRWISLLRHTPFGFDETKVPILRNYLLEGQQWVIWKNRLDISSCGRQVFPCIQSSKAASLTHCFQRMEKVDPEFAADYVKAQHYETLSGNRHFWRSDVMIQRSPDYYFSVKMSSERVIGAETVNMENIRGYYAGDGVTFLYRITHEYEDIFPLWDWRKLPGVTALEESDSLDNLRAREPRNKCSFTGGVSNGQNGIAVMKYDRRGITARKAWFMFSGMIVCLGSGIGSSEGIRVTTSVNQSFLHGDVVLKTGREQRPAGETENISDPVWLLHDSTGYFFPSGGNLTLETGIKKGSWNRVVQRFKDEKLKAGIFKLWFDHGAYPADQNYAYILVPGACEAELKKMERRFPFGIINQTDRQEVITRDGKTGGVVFYEPGKSSIFGGVEVNEPCIVMINKQNGATYLSVADPVQKLKEVLIRTGRKTPKTITIALPQGGEAGKSVTLKL